MLKFIKGFTLHHALAASLGVFSAFIINYYYSFSNEYWIVLAAFLVCQTTRGTPVKQAMIIFLTMIAALIISSLLLMGINNHSVIYIFLTLLFIVSTYLNFIYRSPSNKWVFLAILFSVVVLIATLSPVMSPEFMQNRLMDVVIGAFIGMICSFIIAPVKLEYEFSKGVIPILNCFNEYSQALTDALLARVSDKDDISSIRIRIENALQENPDKYPVWVYEVGFNRGLRSGFRFFLVNIERIAEVYFSMDCLMSRGMDSLILKELNGTIENVMQKNQELLSILIGYFQQKKIEYTQSDFTSDIIELEKALHRIVPDNIEVLDISPNFLLITAFIRDMKDLRGLLLQLVMALPTTKH